LCLLNPDEPGIKPAEKAKRSLARKRLMEARVLRFLALRCDETPAGYGRSGVNAFIKDALKDSRVTSFPTLLIDASGLQPIAQ
jgi:putative transposase